MAQRETQIMRNYLDAIASLQLPPLSERLSEVQEAVDGRIRSQIESDAELAESLSNGTAIARAQIDRDGEMFEIWSEKFDQEVGSNGPYSARELEERLVKEAGNMQRLTSGYFSGQLMFEPYNLDPKYCVKQVAGGISIEDRTEIYKVSVEELSRVGKYWDPEAAIGPPMPRFVWTDTGLEMCPCYMDRRICLNCWSEEELETLGAMY